MPDASSRHFRANHSGRGGIHDEDDASGSGEEQPFTRDGDDHDEKDESEGGFNDSAFALRRRGTRPRRQPPHNHKQQQQHHRHNHSSRLRAAPASATRAKASPSPSPPPAASLARSGALSHLLEGEGPVSPASKARALADALESGALRFGSARVARYRRGQGSHGPSFEGVDALELREEDELWRDDGSWTTSEFEATHAVSGPGNQSSLHAALFPHTRQDADAGDWDLGSGSSRDGRDSIDGGSDSGSGSEGHADVAEDEALGRIKSLLHRLRTS